MNKPHTILLIPHPSDPHKLLGDTDSVAWRCGARVPVMSEYGCQCGTKTEWRAQFVHAAVKCESCGELCGYRTRRRALVLRHNGEDIPEGIDHAARCDPRTDPAAGQWASAMALAECLAADGLGTIILLDAAGEGRVFVGVEKGATA